MIRSTIPLCLVVAAALSGGCYGTTTVEAGYATTTPETYYAEPGVYVVASDVPTFYADGAYWLYDAGSWYRAPSYGARWVVTTRVPYAVRHIRQPHVYARAHLRGHRVYRSTPPRYRQDIRDHRTRVYHRDARRDDRRGRRGY